MAEFSITRPSDNRLDIALTGQVDADDMRRLLDEFVEKAEGIERGLILYEITDFHMPTASALMVEFSRLPRLMAHAAKFRKAAVISDAAWLRRAAEVEGALLPFIKIDAFTPDQREAAEAWLTAG